MSRRKLDPALEWSAKLSSAQELINARETAAARRVLNKLISFVEKTWGPDDGHLIRPLRLMAASHFSEHQPLDPRNGEEVEYLRRALAVARRSLGDDHCEVALLAGKLGSTLVIGGSLEDGCALIAECLELAERLGELDYFSRYFGLLAHARMMQGRPHDALGLFEKAVTDIERNLPSSLGVARAHYHLAECLRQLGRLGDARAELELALTLADTPRARSSMVDRAILIADVKAAIALLGRGP